MSRFDVFLSHNSQDKPIVRELAAALKGRGLKVWLDEEQLVPGRPWVNGLEEAIQTANAAAVLVGKNGFGPWEIPEMQACLQQFVKRGLPVIPVLMPGIQGEPSLPLFLQGHTWVDLREGLNKEGIDRLEWGITNVKPDSLGQTHSPSNKSGDRKSEPRTSPAQPESNPIPQRDQQTATPQPKTVINQKIDNKYSHGATVIGIQNNTVKK